MKHSPAPWRWVEHGNIIVDERGDQVAELHGENRGADGRLLAAAPELLALLKRAQAYIDAVLQAFEGHPYPSEIEGKNLDVEMLALIERVEERKP